MPPEIHAAFRMAVNSNRGIRGIDEERLLVEAVRLLGFRTMGPKSASWRSRNSKSYAEATPSSSATDRLQLTKQST